MGDAHALAAAAGRSLDHHRIADLVGDLHRRVVVLDDAEMARHGRDLGGGGRLLGLDLVAHGGDRLGVRADEDDAGLGQRHRKGLALGQEAVARMHGLGAGRLAGGDDLVDDEIALGRRRRADGDGLVGHLDVQRVPVGVGIDRDRLDPHPAGGLDDPAGDFAAIGDQDALEHGGRIVPHPTGGRLCGSAAKSQSRPHLRRDGGLTSEGRAPPSGRPSAARRAP